MLRSCAGLSPTEACFRAAGAIGKVWRQRRRDLPPDVRGLVAETLLALRLHVLPGAVLGAVGAIGRSRYDIRGISEMLKHLAKRDGIGPLLAQPSNAPAAAVSSDPFTTVLDFIGAWEPLVASLPVSAAHVEPEDVLSTAVCRVSSAPRPESSLDLALPSADEVPTSNADSATTHVSGAARELPLATVFFELLEQDAYAIISRPFPSGADSGAG